MYPIIRQFKTPSSFSGFLPEQITIYSYGLFIFLSIVICFIYFRSQSIKYGIKTEDVGLVFIIAIVAAFLGGKFLYFLESPSYNLSHFKDFVKNWRVGFVFFGSFITVIIALYFTFKKLNLPIYKAFDWLAICGMIIHGFGKIGCFLAGCCFGNVCNKAIGVIYTHPLAIAKPLNTPLYPVQLIDAVFILSMLVIALIRFNKKPFDGYWMLFYTICYSVIRFFTEMLRGDESRGYIIEGILTHSQLIALVLIVFCLILIKRIKKGKLQAT